MADEVNTRIELPSEGFFSQCLNEKIREQNAEIDSKKVEDLGLLKVSQTKINGITPLAYNGSQQYIVIADEGIVNVYQRQENSEVNLIQSFKFPDKINQLLLSDYLLTTLAFSSHQIAIYEYQRNLTGKYYKQREILEQPNNIALMLPVHCNGIDNTQDDRENEIDVIIADGSVLNLLKIESKVEYQKLMELPENIIQLEYFKLQGIVFSDILPFKTSNNEEYTLIIYVQTQSMIEFFAFEPNGQLVAIRKEIEVNMSDNEKICCCFYEKDEECEFLVEQQELIEIYKIITLSGSESADIEFARISQISLTEDYYYIEMLYLTDELLLGFTSAAYILIDPYRSSNHIVDEQSYPHFPFHKKSTQAISKVGKNTVEIVGYDTMVYLQRFELASLNERIDNLLSNSEHFLAMELLLDECCKKHENMQTFNDIMLTPEEKYCIIKEDASELVCIIAKKYIDIAVMIIEHVLSKRDDVINIYSTVMLTAAFCIADIVYPEIKDTANAKVWCQEIMELLTVRELAMETLTLTEIAQTAEAEIQEIELIHAFDERSVKNYIVLSQNKSFGECFPIIVLIECLLCMKQNSDFPKEFFDQNSEYSIFTVLEQCIKNSNKMKSHLLAFTAIFEAIFLGKLDRYQEGEAIEEERYYLASYLSQFSFIELIENSKLILKSEFATQFKEEVLDYFIRKPKMLQIQEQETTYTCLWAYIDGCSMRSSLECVIRSEIVNDNDIVEATNFLKDVIFNKKSGIILAGESITELLELLSVCILKLSSSKELQVIGKLQQQIKFCFDDNEEDISRVATEQSYLRPYEYAYCLKSLLSQKEMEDVKQISSNLEDGVQMTDLYLDSAFCVETLPILGVMTKQIFEFFTNIDLSLYQYDDFEVNLTLFLLNVLPISGVSVAILLELLLEYNATQSFTNKGILNIINIIEYELEEKYDEAFNIIMTSEIPDEVKGLILCKYLLIFNKVQANIEKKYILIEKGQLDDMIIKKMEQEKEAIINVEFKLGQKFWPSLYKEKEKYEFLNEDLLELLMKSYKYAPLKAFLLCQECKVDDEFMIELLSIYCVDAECNFADNIGLDQDFYTREQNVLKEAIGQKLKCDVTNEQVMFYDDDVKEQELKFEKIRENKSIYGSGIFGFFMEHLTNTDFTFLLDSKAQLQRVLLDNQSVLKFIDDKNTPPSLSLKLLYLLNSHEKLQNMLLVKFEELSKQNNNDGLLKYMAQINMYFTEKKNDENAQRFRKLLDIAYHISDYATRDNILQQLADLFAVEMTPPDCLKYFLDLFEQSSWGDAHALIDKLIKRIDLTNSINQELADIISHDVEYTSSFRTNYLKKGVICDSICICGQNVDELLENTLHEEKVILQDNSILMLKVQEESNAVHFFSCGHCCHEQCLDESAESLEDRQRCIEKILLSNGDNQVVTHLAKRTISCPECE